MIKKLTRNLLSTILTALLAVGVFGIAAPKHVHAAGEVYTVTASYGGTTYNIVTNGSVGDEITLATIKSIINVGTMRNQKSINKVNGSALTKKDHTTLKIASTGTGTIEFSEKNPPNGTDISVSFQVTMTQTHTHTWNNNSYSASGNKITATCQGKGTCDLTKPTLTLTASGKTYDGSVVTATLSKSSTWSSQGLPTPTITYSPENSKNAGTYTASAKVGNATATQSFTITPKEIGLTWGTSTFTYDGESHAPAATISGVVSGDTCNVTVDGAKTDAGNYNATASIDNNNYTLPSNKTKDFTINKRALTLKDVTTEYKVYDGSDSVKITNPDQVILDNVVDEDDVSIDKLTGVYTDGKDVGENKAISVTATLKGEKKHNYEVTPKTDLTESIVKKAVVVEGITAKDKPYDGNTDATVDTSGAEFANMVPGDNLSISATGEFEDANVGEGKTVNLTLGELAGADASNYIFDKIDSQKTATASITAKDMTVSAEGYEGNYDETAHRNITVTVTDPADGYTITYKGPNDADYSTTNPSFTDPGTYEVAYKVTAAPNYTEFTGTATIKIKGQDFEGVLGMPYSGVYDGIEHGIGVVVEPLGLEDFVITYSESESGPYGDEIKYKDFTDGAKTIYFKVSKKGYNDYKGSSTVNITQKEIGLEWSDTAFVYDGQKHVPTATVKEDDLVGEDKCDVTVEGAQTNSNAKTETENYTATATELSNNNYKLPASVTQTFTINQKEVTLDWGETALTYNGQEQRPEVTIEDLVDGETCKATVEGAKTDSNAKSGTEKYTAEVTGLSDANYKLSQTAETTKDFTIAQAKITVSGIKSLNKKYDGNDDATKSLYFTEAKLDGKVAGEVLGVKATGTFPKSVVGDYTITLDNLELTGDDIIKDNYVLAETGQQTTCEGSITKFEVTVTADNKEKFYGEDDPTFTFKSDPKVLVDDDVLEGELSRVKDENSENVGNHVINAGTLHDHNHNYAIKFIEGTLTIKQATSNTVTASIKGWTYGNPANSPGATGKFGADTATFTYSDSADGEYSSNVPTQAGTYYVKATVEGTDNYPGAVSEPVEFEISPKEIGLQWGETAFVYDGDSHVPTATATNLVVGDECEVTVDGAQTDSNAKAGIENYTATASISNPNYKLPTNNTTTFTIAQKEVTVSGITAKDKTYDRNDKAELNYDEVVLDEIVGQEEVSVEATGTFEDKNAKEDKTVTISNLTLTGKDAGNYILASEGQQKDTTATINKKPIKVTANEHEKYYGDDDPTELTYEVDPELVEGDEFTGSLVREEGEDVGDYDIEKGTLSAGNNYDIDYTPNTFVILQADNSVTASIEGWTYGDDANKPTATADFGEETVVFTYSDKEDGDYSEDVPTQAGTYYLKASIAETNNYKGATSVPVEFTIDQKEVELEWSDTELIYNGTEQKPTAKVTNLEDKDECEVTVEGEQKDSNIKTGTDSYTAKATKLSNDNYKLPEEDEKKTTEFTIAPKELTSNMLSVDPESIKNDGTKKGPNITLNDKEVDVDLTDEDYDLSGETESDKSGTHFFEVKGKGNYTGSLSSSWVMYENRQNYDKQEGTDGKGDIEIYVDVIGNTENITVDNFTIDFAKKLLSEEDLERYNNGENVLIYVELEEESKDDVATKDKELILSEFNKVAAKDIRWFDITVWKRIGNDKATQVHDTVDNLEMTISVPDEYKNAPADNTRTFYLARSHDGEADILTKTNEKKVGLSSNKFSIYALAYKDTYHGSKYIVPKTGIE